MLPVRTLIKRIRTRVHDQDQIEYLDEEVLDTINEAVRFIRRAIVQIRPAILISRHEGTINAGESSFELPKRPTKIYQLTIGTKIIKTETNYYSQKVYRNDSKVFRNNDPAFTKEVIDTYSERALKQTDIIHVISDDSDRSGLPKVFYLTGNKTINLYPVPNQKIKYTALTVDDVEELTLDDDSPLNNEFDDFIIEYATIRLAIKEEFDMSQESQMFSNIYAQIQQLISPPPAGFIVKSYWTKSRRRDDY